MIPSFPSRVTLCPVFNILVAFLTAVTAGMPYSLETTAPWERMPPVSVMSPPIFENTAVQPGSVLQVTNISWSSISDRSAMDCTTRSLPLQMPGLEEVPAILRWSPSGAGLSSNSTFPLRNLGGMVSL